MQTVELSPRAERAQALECCLSVVAAVNRLREEKGSEEGRLRVERAQDVVPQALAIVDEDLAPESARRPARQPAFVAAADVAKAVVARVGDLAEASRVEMFVRCGTGGLVGDANALAEALGSFVVDAIEATPPGGGVVVATYECVDGTQLWTVENTGRDVTSELAKRGGAPGGAEGDERSGLGVEVACATIERHGGHTRFEARPGSGKLVIIELPVAAARPSRGTIDAVDAHAVEHRGSAGGLAPA